MKIFFKSSRKAGNPKIEYKMFQNQLTMLQMNEITSLMGGAKYTDSSNFGNKQ